LVGVGKRLGEEVKSSIIVEVDIYIASEYMLGLGRESDICIFIPIFFILGSESYIAMVSGWPSNITIN
jgi:hypothetical protein